MVAVGRSGQTLAISLLTAACVSARAQSPPPATQADRNQWYVSSTFGPSSILPSAFFAGVDTVRDLPDEWEQNARGYSQRLAARMAHTGVRNSAELGLVSLLKHDPRYHPSTARGLWPRTGHALASSWVARTENGGRTFAVGRFAGMAAGSLAATAWLPPSQSTWKHTAQSVGIQVGANMGANLLREFWPDVRKRVFGR